MFVCLTRRMIVLLFPLFLSRPTWHSHKDGSEAGGVYNFNWQRDDRTDEPGLGNADSNFQIYGHVAVFDPSSMPC